MQQLFVKATLLPSSDERSIKSPSRRSFSMNNEALFSRSKLNAIIGREFNDKSDKINVYSDLGVELLHILKYTCVNAAGIRKISKKVSHKYCKNELYFTMLIISVIIFIVLLYVIRGRLF